jgi:predicted flavoprotein YhiN
VPEPHKVLAASTEETTMTATGPFTVKLEPQEMLAEYPLLGRLTINKEFHGDLTGTSVGQMLSARTAIPNSAGYVAIEQVTGTLHGREGSFVLQHSSNMVRGEAQQSVTVVPDSGTGQLEGLTGSMVINNAAGAHSYVFEYSLPERDS